jgi:hypothetical protein
MKGGGHVSAIAFTADHHLSGNAGGLVLMEARAALRMRRPGF